MTDSSDNGGQVYIKHKAAKERGSRGEEETIDIPFFTPPHPSYPSQLSACKSSSKERKKQGITSLRLESEILPRPFLLHLDLLKYTYIERKFRSFASHLLLSKFQSQYFSIQYKKILKFRLLLLTSFHTDRSMCLTRVQKISVSRAISSPRLLFPATNWKTRGIGARERFLVRLKSRFTRAARYRARARDNR